jgi:1,4-alpha-glucan branching enzyme
MKISVILNILRAMVIALILVAGSCSYMEKSVESPVLKEGKVIFRYPSHSARTVQVAGDWNNWGVGDAEQGEVLVGLMEKDEKGVWNLAQQLPPGRYRYFFLLNETQRIPDPANPRVADDPWGGKASLLVVP